jgi:hypothetical protein
MGSPDDPTKTLGPATADPTDGRGTRRCLDLPGPVDMDACICWAHLPKETAEVACIFGAELQDAIVIWPPPYRRIL